MAKEMTTLKEEERFVGTPEEYEFVGAENKVKIVAKAASKIETIDPPEEAISLRKLSGYLSPKKSIKISQELRKTYAKHLDKRAFGEMENAVLTYDSERNLAVVDSKIVGAIAFHFDEIAQVIYIDHLGTLMSPKGTGAELVRTVIDAAYRGGVGIGFESTSEVEGFWVRLGFKRNKKITYVFETDVKRVHQIREALGSVGRVKDKKVGVVRCA